LRTEGKPEDFTAQIFPLAQCSSSFHLQLHGSLSVRHQPSPGDEYEDSLP